MWGSRTFVNAVLKIHDPEAAALSAENTVNGTGNEFILHSTAERIFRASFRMRRQQPFTARTGQSVCDGAHYLIAGLRLFVSRYAKTKQFSANGGPQGVYAGGIPMIYTVGGNFLQEFMNDCSGVAAGIAHPLERNLARGRG